MLQTIATGHEIPLRPRAEVGSFFRTLVVSSMFVLIALMLTIWVPNAYAAETTSQQTADTVQASISRISIEWNTFVYDDLTKSWTQIKFESECSGFTVDPDGYIVTAGHCLDPELASESAIEYRARDLYDSNKSFFQKEGITLQQLIAYGKQNWKVEGKAQGSDPTATVEVTLPSGLNSEESTTYTGTVLEVDATNDVALLQIDASGLPALELADEDEITIGESVFAVGFPALRDDVTDPSNRPTFKQGSISDTGATRNDGEVPIYETSAPMGQGMSGGPTVNSDGEVIGVNSYGTTLNNDFNWIAPSHLVSDLLEDNGVDGELSQTDITFRQALAAFYSEDYRTASAKLQAVLDEQPDHPVALRLIEDAKEGAKTQPLPDNGIEIPGAALGVAGAILASLAVSFVMGRAFARRMSPGVAMAAPVAISMPIPAPPVQAAPVQKSQPIGFQPPAPAQPRAMATSSVCPSCGMNHGLGAKSCQRCGSSL